MTHPNAQHSVQSMRNATNQLTLPYRSITDSPVYFRAQQQLRRQQSEVVQQRSLEHSESEASFNSLNKKRLISTTRSDPGSPNVVISTSAISASPAESTCSSPQRYEPRMGDGHRGTFRMWGIAEVSSINEDSGHRKSLEDEDRGGLILMCSDSEEQQVENNETVDQTSMEVNLEDIGTNFNADTIENQCPNNTLDFPSRPTEEDRNITSLYNIVTAKRRSRSTCCILQDASMAMQSKTNSVYLIEDHSPTRILAKHMSRNSTNNNCVNCDGGVGADCVNHCSFDLVDTVNNNNQHCKHVSSPNSSLPGGTPRTASRNRPMSKSFSLFNSAHHTNMSLKPLSPIITMADSGESSHSSLFKLFSSSGAKQRVRSFKFNKRSLSNDK